MIGSVQVIKNLWQNYRRESGGHISVISAVLGAPMLVLLGAHMGTPSLANSLNTPNPPTVAQDVAAPAYIYHAELTKVYDADTWRADIDLGVNTWRRNEPLRLYGLDAPEIKRSKAKGHTRAHVNEGYKCRDIMLSFLGLAPQNYARKAKYIKINTPVPVIIQTIKDEEDKYGRMLAIIHKDGINLNQKLIASGCAKADL